MSFFIFFFKVITKNLCVQCLYVEIVTVEISNLFIFLIKNRVLMYLLNLINFKFSILFGIIENDCFASRNVDEINYYTKTYSYFSFI